MLTKVDRELVFNKKRNTHLQTPCCHKNNKDGKFVNYKGYPDHFGYCFSCGQSSLPPSVYENDKGEKYIWDETLNTFKSVSGELLRENLSFKSQKSNCKANVNHKTILYDIKRQTCKTIGFDAVKLSYNNSKSNNLISYLHKLYNHKKVKTAVEMYCIGTSPLNWTVFWYIDKKNRVRKSKEVLYNSNGKRTNKFKVPYKNEDDYYFCLYGEHLLLENTKPIILTESEKTAIVCSIQYPNYTWLAYSGINGLTDQKLLALKGLQIVIIPDMSSKALKIIRNKKEKFEALDISYKVLDLTYGKTDDELKEEGLYNADIEDIIRDQLL